VGVLGYAAGLIVSATMDLPSGALIVCAMALIGAAMALLTSRPQSRI
jgi:ABC-type Mn2+/Zn2+ transport system permease subunit